MDAAACRGLDAACGGFDVLVLATGKGSDDGAADFAGDLANGFGVAFGGDGESGFEDVDAEGLELVGHAEFFVMVHGAAGGLLPSRRVVSKKTIWSGALINIFWHFRLSIFRYHNPGL